MKHKTTELEGELLDLAVAKAMGYRWLAEVPEDLCGTWYAGECDGGINNWEPHENWAQAGPIIERERISLQAAESGGWYTYFDHPTERDATAAGPTALIAAMRAYVASKLGDEVDLCPHKNTKSVAEGMIYCRCLDCGMGKNDMGDWC